MKSRLGWMAFFVLFTITQIVAVQVGQGLADRHSYSQGMCKINGLWNTARICREKHVKGDVWQNYDGTYRPA